MSIFVRSVTRLRNIKHRSRNVGLAAAAGALVLFAGCGAETRNQNNPPQASEVIEAEVDSTMQPDPYLGFSKFVVQDLDKMEAFYVDVFGFEKENTVDFLTFEERVLRLPEGKSSLVLYHYKDGREIIVGNAHGPIGIMTKNVDELHARALAAGASEKTPPVDFGPVRVSFFFDPEGHEVELIDMTGAENSRQEAVQ